MTQTAAANASESDTFNVRTASGVVHRLTEGRTFTHYGVPRTNRQSNGGTGKADCGTLTSSAATVTKLAVTCPKCLDK